MREFSSPFISSFKGTTNFKFPFPDESLNNLSPIRRNFSHPNPFQHQRLRSTPTHNQVTEPSPTSYLVASNPRVLAALLRENRLTHTPAHYNNPANEANTTKVDDFIPKFSLHSSSPPRSLSSSPRHRPRIRNFGCGRKLSMPEDSNEAAAAGFHSCPSSAHSTLTRRSGGGNPSPGDALSELSLRLRRLRMRSMSRGKVISPPRLVPLPLPLHFDFRCPNTHFEKTPHSN